MQIVGVTTGVEFENLMINTLRRAGLTVFDTPATNDYGADLIIEYNGHRLAGQCKYYNKPVGVKAVQEVMGALAYYECDAGIVFTNDCFTQQAVNLAEANSILLFDEGTLDQCFNDYAVFFDIFDDFFRNTAKPMSKMTKMSDETWTLKDLVIRYGVSQDTIMKDFMPYGMPYFKVGREYRFTPRDVIWWEIDMHYVPYGKGRMVLPGHVNYRNQMNKRIREAKRNHDEEKVKKLKRLMKSHKVSRFSEKAQDRIKAGIAISICIGPVLIFLLYNYFSHR